MEYITKETAIKAIQGLCIEENTPQMIWSTDAMDAVRNAPGGWISVKDKLPRDCERVIVYMERDAWDRKGKFRRKKDIEKGWQIDGVWHVDGCSRVLGLYWMPLPEPPEEV